MRHDEGHGGECTVSWQADAAAAARRYGINPTFFTRQMGQEAHGADLTSPAGAQGPAQIMPATARAWGVRNVHNRAEAYDAAAKHMALYLHQFGGSWAKALAAYNAGPGTAASGKYPAETRNYISVILGGRGDVQGGSEPTGKSFGIAVMKTTPSHTHLAVDQAIIDALSSGTKQQDLAKNVLNRLAYAPQYTVTTPGKTTTQRVQVANPDHAPVVGHHDVNFDGKPVVAWIAGILKAARASGLWKGNVTSGERTKAQQLAAAKHFGLSNYGPGGPLGSNHVIGHDGAVDVTDPQGLKRALAHLGINKLRSSMPNDPVHFSRTGY